MGNELIEILAEISFSLSAQGMASCIISDSSIKGLGENDIHNVFRTEN